MFRGIQLLHDSALAIAFRLALFAIVDGGERNMRFHKAGRHFDDLFERSAGFFYFVFGNVNERYLIADGWIQGTDGLGTLEIGHGMLIILVEAEHSADVEVGLKIVGIVVEFFEEGFAARG